MCEEGTLQYSPSSELCAKKLAIGKESNEQQRKKKTQRLRERDKRTEYSTERGGVQRHEKDVRCRLDIIGG